MVQHHLLLPETATRRDLRDPRTAANVAEAVGDLATLELLHALTEADSRATGSGSVVDVEAVTARRAASATATDVIRGEASPATVPRRVGHLAPPRAPWWRPTAAVHVEHDDQGDVDVLRIASRDRAGLFAHIAGVLAAARTRRGRRSGGHRRRRSGRRRVPHLPRAAVTAQLAAKVENDLRGAVSGEVDIDSSPRPAPVARSQPSAASRVGLAPRLEVLVSNEASDSTTVVEVRAPDAPAVLYGLATRAQRIRASTSARPWSPPWVTRWSTCST